MLIGNLKERITGDVRRHNSSYAINDLVFFCFNAITAGVHVRHRGRAHASPRACTCIAAHGCGRASVSAYWFALQSEDPGGSRYIAGTSEGSRQDLVSGGCSSWGGVPASPGVSWWTNQSDRTALQIA